MIIILNMRNKIIYSVGYSNLGARGKDFQKLMSSKKKKKKKVFAPI